MKGEKALSIHNRKIRWMLPLSVVVVILGCSDQLQTGDPTVAGRGYTAAQVELGRSHFLRQCADCHGEVAEGTADWRKTDANGNYPPPPLNGTAHGWHHPLSILERTVADGGVPLGGVMPGFSETLSKDEARATIAYFQSFWSDDIYTRWQEINSR